MMWALVCFHRWLGIGFCLLFAMWFATGIVMHFVPFPALTEAERAAGLLPIDPARVARGPAEAIDASHVADATSVRLRQRSDGPVYLVTGRSGVNAIHATDLTTAPVTSEPLARSIATDHARRRGLSAADAGLAERVDYDQWIVPNGFDRHRPLYRIALNDDAGTDVYVSSTTGDVVLDTTARERRWNYLGSVLHWIYPTFLRSHWAAWDRTVWWVSLAALVIALSGALLGPLRLSAKRGRLTTPYRGWHAWHHVLGLTSLLFILTWSLSGWLSMDHGRLFSRGQATDAERAAVTGIPAWSGLPPDEPRRIGAAAIEVEWLAFDGVIYRRERTGVSSQRLTIATAAADTTVPAREFLAPDDVRGVTKRLAPGCAAAVKVETGDNYAMTSAMPNAPVYRLVCGDTWFHIDGANGAMLEVLDPSRRRYRWLYSGLHTFDIPFLTARPALRTGLIVLLCGLGFLFSLTSVVIGWKRLRT